MRGAIAGELDRAVDRHHGAGPSGGGGGHARTWDDRRRLWADSARRFRAEAADDRITGVAAEVAFFAFLGVFPGLLALAATLGFLDALLGADVADRTQRVVVGFLDGVLGERASGTVEAVDSLFDDRDVALLSFAGAGLVWSVWRSTRAAMRALAVVYDAEEDRSPLKVAGLALVFSVSTLLLAALVLAMFVIGPLFGGGRVVARVVGLGSAFATLWTWARLPLAAALLVGWATLLFRTARHRRGSLRSEVPGAVVTGVLWLAFSAGLHAYLRVAGGASQVLGAIGGVMTVLLWVYLLSLALLVGAEVNAVRQAASPHGRPPDGRRDGEAAR